MAGARAPVPAGGANPNRLQMINAEAIQRHVDGLYGRGRGDPPPPLRHNEDLMPAAVEARRMQAIYGGMPMNINPRPLQPVLQRGRGRAIVRHHHANPYMPYMPAQPPPNPNPNLNLVADQQARHEHVMAVIAQQRAQIEAMNAAQRR